MCIILCAKLDWPRSSDARMWIWVCASMCVRGVSKNKRMWLFRWQRDMEDGETKRVPRHVQMYIDEDLANRLLNK